VLISSSFHMFLDLQFTFMQESALMGSGGFHDLIENETA
jgi:hypothetical protein